MISHPSLPEVVRNTLRRRILNNELAAGERLIEASLAAEFGVSRTTLRAALMELKNDRLVEFLPRRGCSVARMSRAEVEDACFARYLLESGAACEDRAVIDDDLVASLDKEMEVMSDAAAAGDLAAIVESDTRLHGLLVEAGGRARLSELWHSLDGQMGALMRSSLEFQGSDLSEVVDRHKTLIDAVRGRDRAVLAGAIKEHYLSPRSFHDHDREDRDGRDASDGQGARDGRDASDGRG
ncbi:MAG TPA: GntR family transcriptional regulator [Streptosporangiaceae bacterium]|nr:GntR family transcriptional regulator [Streptosporangiaceae bacterium]